ncbi:MAG: hypothetical protein V4463_09575 [Pseudomonadota bacterium]
MYTNFASLSYSLRAVCRQGGIDLKLGHAQQLLACAFGYKSLAAYQASTYEPTEIVDDAHLILDSGTIDQRAFDLGVALSGREVEDLLAKAFTAQRSRCRIHGSSDVFFDYLHDRLQNVVANDANVSGYTADMNTDGLEEIYVPFDFQIEDLPDVGEALRIEVAGHIRMTADIERPFAGDQVDFEAAINMNRVGRRMINDIEMHVERARPGGAWAAEDEDYPPRGPLISRPQAYANLLEMDVALIEQLENVSIDENSGNSGQGFYGYVIDFTDASPDEIVHMIDLKHDTTIFFVEPTFFENVEDDE